MEEEILLAPDAETYQNHCGKVNPIIVAEKLGTPLHSKQLEICKHFLRENRMDWDYYSVLAGRRFGKSFVMRIIALAELLSPAGKIAFITPTMKLAEKHFLALDRMLKKKFPELKGKYKSLKQKFTIEFEEFESILICASFDSWDERITGDGLTLIIYDEVYKAHQSPFSPIKEKEMMETLEPTLATYGNTEKGALYGKTLALGTPRGTAQSSTAGINHLMSISKDSKFRFYRGSEYTVYDNPLIPNSTIDRLKGKMSESTFNREFMVKFEDSHTSVLRNFDKQKHAVKVRQLQHLKNRDDLYLVTAYDYGQADGNAGLFALYDERIKTYYFVDGTYAKNRLTRDLYSKGISIRDSLIKEFNISESNVVYFGDPSSPELIKLGFIDYGMPIMKAKNNRKEGFDCLNEHLEGTPDVISTIYIDESLDEVIRQWEFAQFKEINGTVSNNYNRDSMETHFEFVDTARYIVYTFDKYIRKNTILVA